MLYLKAVESVNTSGVPFLLAFNLKNHNLYIFFVCLAWRNVNHAFVHASKPVNKWAVPYLTFHS